MLSSKAILSDGILLTGSYDPDLIKFEQGDLEGVTHIPSFPQTTKPEYRPGYPIFIAKGYFTVGESQVSLGDAQKAGFVTIEPVTVKNLVHGGSYLAGEYVRTPDPNKLIVEDINYNNCYMTKAEGATVLHLKVEETMTFVVPQGQTYSDAVNTLASFGPTTIVDVISFVDCGGYPIFADSPFRHQALFPRW